MMDTNRENERLMSAENSRLREENARLRRFIEMGKLLGIERNMDRLVPLVMREISLLLSADRSTLFLIDMDNLELWTKYAEGVVDRKIRIDLKMGVVGLCALTGRLLNITDAYESPYFSRSTDQVTGYRTQSLLCAPVFDKSDRIAGVVELLNKNTGVFSKKDEERILSAAVRFHEMFQTTGIPDKRSAEELVAELRRNTGSDRGSLFLLDPEGERLVGLVTEGVEGQEIRLNMRVGIAGYVAVTGQDVVINDAYSDSRFDSGEDRRTGYHTESILCVPVAKQTGEILGVIQAINKKGSPFDDSDRDILKAFVPQIAIALENAMLFEEQTAQFQSLLEVLAASIDAKDPLTAGHSHKVAEYSTGIARELGFNEADIDTLKVAALLHDYGKIGVCDGVLKKPGRLTPEEYEHIKLHVKYTRSILGKMRFIRKYRNVPFIAASHHERLDGTGYDGGCNGSDIPFMGKILAVADVFEALTARRHYREALPAEEAFTILDRDVGTHFDGNIVEAMKRYWKTREEGDAGHEEG